MPMYVDSTTEIFLNQSLSCPTRGVVSTTNENAGAALISRQVLSVIDYRCGGHSVGEQAGSRDVKGKIPILLASRDDSCRGRPLTRVPRRTVDGEYVVGFRLECVRCTLLLVGFRLVSFCERSLLYDVSNAVPRAHSPCCAI